MEVVLNMWQAFLDVRVWIFPLPALLWVVGSYILSAVLIISERKRNARTSHFPKRQKKPYTNTFMVFVMAPLFWPVALFSVALSLVMVDVGNGLARMYRRPLEYAIFAAFQIIVVVPSMPDRLLVFLSGEGKELVLYWSHVGQYVVVLLCSLAFLWYWFATHIAVAGRKNIDSLRGTGWPYLSACASLVALVLAGGALFFLVMSQIFTSFGNFLIIAAIVWASMVIDELTKKQPQMAELFSGALAVLRAFRIIRR